MDKIIKYHIAEYLLLVLILSFTIGNPQPDVVSIIGLSTVLILLIFQVNFLGVLIGILLQFFALFLFLAMISEANEFTTLSSDLTLLVIAGFLLSMMVSAIGMILISKYGGTIFKGLIGD